MCLEVHHISGIIWNSTSSLDNKELVHLNPGQHIFQFNPCSHKAILYLWDDIFTEDSDVVYKIAKIFQINKQTSSLNTFTIVKIYYNTVHTYYYSNTLFKQMLLVPCVILIICMLCYLLHLYWYWLQHNTKPQMNIIKAQCYHLHAK